MFVFLAGVAPLEGLIVATSSPCVELLGSGLRGMEPGGAVLGVVLWCVADLLGLNGTTSRLD